MKTFKKEERLCSKKHLDLLFHEGSSFLLYPYRITYLSLSYSHSSPAQLVVNVGKKRFKRAVDRNLIKRRIREIYRINKQDSLYSHLNKPNFCLLLGVHYVGKEILSYSLMSKKLQLVLNKLITQLVQDESH